MINLRIFDLYIKIKKNVKIKVDKLNKTIRNYLNINEQPRNNYIVKKFEKTISGKIKFLIRLEISYFFYNYQI